MIHVICLHCATACDASRTRIAQPKVKFILLGIVELLNLVKWSPLHNCIYVAKKRNKRKNEEIKKGKRNVVTPVDLCPFSRYQTRILTSWIGRSHSKDHASSLTSVSRFLGRGGGQSQFRE